MTTIVSGHFGGHCFGHDAHLNPWSLKSVGQRWAAMSERSGDDRVWIARTSYQRYHTDKDCPRIKGEATSRLRSEIEADDRFEVCRICDGYQLAPVKYDSVAYKLRQASPEDLGLSPIGERRAQR